MANGKPGRPTMYSREIAEEVCRRLSAGESLRAIERSPGMPAVSTVVDWSRQNRDGFSEMYMDARRAQAWRYLDEIIDLADDSSGDYKQTERGPKFDKEAVMRSRLMVDTRKWYLSKILPKIFGERVALDHSGEIKGGVLVVPQGSEPDEWAQLARRQQAALGKNGTHGMNGNGNGNGRHP